MNKIFIEKLKNALESKHPLEKIKELINEYEELFRLAKWREDIILSGKGYYTHKKELNQIKELLEENGYFTSIEDHEFEVEVRKFFDKLKV